MRYLQAHRKGHNDPLQVVAVDEPRYGGVNCRYDITGFNTVYNPSADSDGGFP